MSSINLMSLSARRKECVRMRMRFWGFVLAVIGGALALVTIERYVAYRSTFARQFALETKYEPIAELKIANQALSRQIAAIRGEQQFVLALSEREPTITLLGLLGQAVANVDHRVFLQKIELINQGMEPGPTFGKKTILELAGAANNGSAVNEYADYLRKTLSFGKVEITSTKENKIKQQVVHEFSLHMDF